MKNWIDPNRNAIMLLSFPLHMLLIFALILPKVKCYAQQDMQDRDSLLSALFYVIPIPHNFFQRWLVNQVVEWIYRERGSLFTLMQLGVSETGVLPK